MTFLRENSGNIAVSFALLLFPILIFVGMAVDFDRRESAERHLRASVDLAVLAAARYSMENEDATVTEIKTVAADYFAQNFAVEEDLALEDPVISVLSNEITFSIQGRLDTAMMSLAGFETMLITAEAASQFEDDGRIELALVLDNSHSMEGARMAALEVAANSLIDHLIVDGEDVAKIAVVPFSNFVNVGLSNASATWLDVPAPYTETSVSCPIDETASYAAGCTLESHTSFYDGMEQTGTTWVCPDNADGTPGAPVIGTCTTTTSTNTWYGCVRSRVSSTMPPLDEVDGHYNLYPIVGHLTPNDWGCPSAITPLTNDTATAKAAVSSMKAESYTYIATGLMWGLRVLSARAPFTEGKESAAFAALNGRKALILMSDGANTRSASTWDGNHWDSDVGTANAKTAAVCELIKSEGIRIYTIAFDVGDIATEIMLENCASSSADYYDATDATQLQNAFDDIGSRLKDIALAR